MRYIIWRYSLNPAAFQTVRNLPLHGYETMINLPRRPETRISLTKGKKYIQGNPVPIAAGEWFTMELIADGNRFKIKVNGITTAEFVDENNEHPIGPIGIHHVRERYQFRKIEDVRIAASPHITAADSFPCSAAGSDWLENTSGNNPATGPSKTASSPGACLSLALYSRKRRIIRTYLRIDTASTTAASAVS